MLSFIILTTFLSTTVGGDVIVPLEVSIGSGPFHPRVSVTLTQVQAPGGLSLLPLYKPNSTTPDLVTAQHLSGFTAALEEGGYFRLRAQHTSGSWVVGSVRLVRQ